MEAAIAAARGGHARLVSTILQLPKDNRWSGVGAAGFGPGGGMGLIRSGPVAAAGAAEPRSSALDVAFRRSSGKFVQTAALRLLEAVVEGLTLEDMAAVYAAWFDPSDPAYRNPVWQLLPRSSGGMRGTQQDTSTLGDMERMAEAAALERKSATDELLFAAAAGSRTVDWRAKIIWLLRKGHMPQQSTHHAQAAARAAACPDALERLQWLHAYQGLLQDVPAASQYRFPVCYPRVAAEALSHGRTDALRYVLQLAGACVVPAAGAGGAAGGQQDGTRAQALLDAIASEQGLLEAAAAGGQLEGLQLLHAAGCRMPYQAMAVASARHGRAAVLGWLLDVCPVASQEGILQACQPKAAAHLSIRGMLRWLRGKFARVPVASIPVADGEIQLVPALCTAAARSGSLEVLQMLRARGCPWDADAIVAGAEAGCEAVLEYLVAEGCMWPGPRVYVAPLAAEDLRTLRCLRRLGLPFCGEQDTFLRAVAVFHSLPLLQWLHEEAGVEVDPGVILERLQRLEVGRQEYDHPDIREKLVWLQGLQEAARQRA